nr:immunoglobulin heavy chain junction region [Macaca mulatta]MOX97035.1 immunoglobulin heavy chain junction region [Macaca mulatta]
CARRGAAAGLRAFNLW